MPKPTDQKTKLRLLQRPQQTLFAVQAGDEFPVMYADAGKLAAIWRFKSGMCRNEPRLI